MTIIAPEINRLWIMKGLAIVAIREMICFFISQIFHNQNVPNVLGQVIMPQRMVVFSQKHVRKGMLKQQHTDVMLVLL